MIGVAIVGLGFMGRHHCRIYADNPKARVVAVCDSEAGKLKPGAPSVDGNLKEVAQSSLDLGGVSTYTSFDELLADPKVELVDITLPTHLHAEFSVKALEAGKHVLCEKPIARTLEQADTMIHAARRSGKRFMVAHCIRFWPEYSLVRDLLARQEYGRVYSAVFRRMSATPTWGWRNWIQDHHKSGGVCLDLHVHDIDYINSLFGLPLAVTSAGVTKTSGGVDHVLTRYHYGEENFLVAAEGCWTAHPAYPFVMSFHVVCESATLDYTSARARPLEVYTSDGGLQTPEVPPGDAYSREIDYFLDCVASSSDPTVLTPTEAREALQVALAEIESVESGRRIDVRQN